MLKKTWNMKSKIYIWLYKNLRSLLKNNVKKQIDWESVTKGFLIKIAHTN